MNEQNNLLAVVISDIHGEYENVSKILNLYNNRLVICLGDITDLFNKNKTDKNQNTIDLFIKNKIPCVFGNHDLFVASEPNANTYNLNKQQIEYLRKLPEWLELKLSNGKTYRFTHYYTKDIWGFSLNQSSDYDYFKTIFELDKNQFSCLFIGHLHTFFESFKNEATKLICAPALKYGQYLLLYEDGTVELKQL